MATTIDRIAHDVGHVFKVVDAVTSAENGPRTLLAALLSSQLASPLSSHIAGLKTR